MAAKIFQKLEFWILSVPALVVTIGAVAHYGVWRVLWAMPVGFGMAIALRLGKDALADLLEEPRSDARRHGERTKACALGMLIMVYNWLVMVTLGDTIDLLIVWRYRETMPLTLVYCAVYVTSFALPSVVRVITGRSDGGFGEVFVEMERLMLLAAIPLAAVCNLTPGWFAVDMLAAGLVAIAWDGALKYRNERKGVVIERRGWRKWFSRPGIIFEPPMTCPSSLTQIAGRDWKSFRLKFIIRRILPVAWLNLALLLGGAAVLIDRGRGWVLFSFVVVLVVLFFFAAFTHNETSGGWARTLANCAPYGFSYLILGWLVALLGTEDLTLQLATGAFIVGSFEFPLRYVVRGDSARAPDWRCPFFTIGAVLLAIWAQRQGQPWHLCGVVATCAIYPLVVVRRFWPVKPLPPFVVSSMANLTVL